MNKNFKNISASCFHQFIIVKIKFCNLIFTNLQLNVKPLQKKIINNES